MRVNSIKDLRNFQKARRLSSHVTHLVMGKNIWALKLADHLRQKYGESEVKLLSSGPLSLHDLEFKGPTLLRGEENIQALMALYPELPLSAPLVSSFYKDQKLRPYGGRSQMLPLREGEEFFTLPGLRLNLAQIMGEDFPLLLQNNRGLELTYQISSIEKWSHEGKKGWLVKSHDDSQFTCEHFYFAQPPHTLLSLFAKSAAPSADLLEVLAQSEGNLSLEIEFTANKEITNHQETLLLPQSLTYDLGHFIGEFDAFEAAKNAQRFRFFSFVDEEESDHEELTKKVKLLKRNLERVFPILEKAKISEAIILKNAPRSPRPDLDLSWDKLNEELPGLHLIGPWAPLSATFLEGKAQRSPAEISHDVRSLFSLAQIFSSLT